MNTGWMRFLTALCSLWCGAALAQVSPVVVLEVQTENVVVYAGDVVEPSRFATVANATTAATRTFGTSLLIGDITAVNGRPAKGTAMINQRTINLRTTATAGLAIADVVRNAISDYALEILQPDGTPIGSIYASGFSAGPAPPGANSAVTGSNNAVIGGTGAFLGARGQLGAGQTTVANRIASVTEDPSNRRINGGGKFTILVQLIPLSRPEIAATATGSAVFHADFTPVSSARPARSGELLIVTASGLGPTRPGVNPGTAFPQDPLQEVNSPVEVVVGSRAAEVVNKIGWPGTVDMFRIDFRIPEGIAPGVATVQLISAFIPGPEARIPVQ